MQKMQPRKYRGRANRYKPWYVKYREPDGTQKQPGFATEREAKDWVAQNAPQIRARVQLVPLISRATGTTERRIAEAILEKLLSSSPQPVPDTHGTWRLTVSELQALRGPVVYVLMRDGHVLYVGQSSRGLCRPLAQNHHILANFDFTGCEELTVHACRSADEALALEAQLIATLQPQLNHAAVRQRAIFQELDSCAPGEPDEAD